MPAPASRGAGQRLVAVQRHAHPWLTNLSRPAGDDTRLANQPRPADAPDKGGRSGLAHVRAWSGRALLPEREANFERS